MPISETGEKHDKEYWTTFFEIIKRIMEEKGYSCTRSETGPYKLFSNIVKNIESSDIAIAVLTDFNVNVWYELGIRHTLKVGTIMLLQEGQKPPFDVSDFGLIFYKDTIGLEQSIKKDIEEYLEKLDDSVCDRPVISTLNSRAYNTFEKKLEETQQLLWRIINEIPREDVTQGKGKIKRNRILWVDDYPSNNEIIVNLFEDKGIQFDIALTTKQGLEFYKNELYDLIITDMGRGDESDAGLSLIKELKKLYCKTPIVVYASYNAITKYGEEAKKLGAYKVVTGVGTIISTMSDFLGL